MRFSLKFYLGYLKCIENWIWMKMYVSENWFHSSYVSLLHEVRLYEVSPINISKTSKSTKMKIIIIDHLISIWKYIYWRKKFVLLGVNFYRNQNIIKYIFINNYIVRFIRPQMNTFIQKMNIQGVVGHQKASYCGNRTNNWSSWKSAFYSVSYAE